MAVLKCLPSIRSRILGAEWWPKSLKTWRYTSNFPSSQPHAVHTYMHEHTRTRTCTRTQNKVHRQTVLFKDKTYSQENNCLRFLHHVSVGAHVENISAMIWNSNINYFIPNISEIFFFFYILLLLKLGCLLEYVTSLDCYQPGGSHDIIVVAVQSGCNCSYCRHFN